MIDFIVRKRVPAQCRLCGSRPLLRNTDATWVRCANPACNNGSHWHPRVTWPRRLAVDIKATALMWGMYAAQAMAFFLMLGCFMALLALMGCERQGVRPPMPHNPGYTLLNENELYTILVTDDGVYCVRAPGGDLSCVPCSETTQRGLPQCPQRSAP